MQKNPEVTLFLDSQQHPFREEIEELRTIILQTIPNISENIKWNAPNYVFMNEDRITMRINPPKKVQLIFHCGAKIKIQPESRLIQDASGLMDWKENNRAVITFNTMQEITDQQSNLVSIVTDWLNVEMN